MKIRTLYKILTGIFLIVILMPYVVTAELSQSISVMLIHSTGEKQTIRTSEEKVGDFLRSQGIELDKYKKIFPSPKSDLTGHMKIFLYSKDGESSKSTQQESTRSTRTVPERKIYSRALPEDREIVIQGGNPEKKSTSESSEFKQRRVVVEGLVDFKNDQIENLKKRKSIELEATAYSPHANSTYPYNDGFSAVGLPAGYGVVAVDPQVIPLGTRVYVEGYGYAIAADVGSDIQGNRIDLCFHSHQTALEYGRRSVTVYILG